MTEINNQIEERLLSNMFVMSMLTDSSRNFLSDEDINCEFDYDLNVRELKNELYKMVSKKIYEGYNSEDIINEINKIIKNKKYKMISIINKNKIMSDAKRLVLERKDIENE